MYSDRERAALAWTEALTQVAQTGVPDSEWSIVNNAFTPDECAWLSLAVSTTNAWNRIQVGFRAPHADTLMS